LIALLMVFMNIEQLLATIENDPEAVAFDDVIAAIDNEYDFTPSSFRNGGLVNQAGENPGSCKIFAFAKSHGLTEQQTLHCFGDYYRADVLQHPDADNHQNIRHFIKTGWAGIGFSNTPLEKSAVGKT